MDKKCIRCNGPAESILYMLCDTCRDGDRLAEILTSDLIQSARNIRQEMHIVQAVQMGKAEYALRMWEESIYGGKGYETNPPTKVGDWVRIMQANADYYLNQARMFLREEYTG
jgi:hypothetical protein